MKQISFLALLIGTVSLAQAAVTGTVLFSDSFNRPNNVDIDASSVGMSGTLAPAVYQEVFEGSGTASVAIVSNQLNVAQGVGMSSLYIDHNLIDAAILNADGFSISMDVVSITSADDPGNRFGGFGVGNTRDEAAAAKDSFDSAVPLRPNIARANQGIGVSDFYVDLALDQNLRLWSNGALLNTIPVGAASGTITVDFLLTDFNAESQVTAIVCFNGAQVDVQTFTWDNTDSNYIGISGRTAGAGVFLDNLSIAAIYDDRAASPSPANGAISVKTDSLFLSWNKGKDAAGSPNSAVTQHYLYIAESEPNFVGVPFIVPDTADPVSFDDYTFANDKVYYWRVDQSINGSSPSDPNTIVGIAWSFDTSTFPIIDNGPVNTAVFPGQTAELACYFNSMSEPSVIWYRETGDLDTPVTAGGNVSVAVDSLGSDTFVTTLAIANASTADEGLYYCYLENTSGSDNAVLSAAAALAVKRPVAHWTLDLADLQQGQYLDISGEGHHADPNIVPDSSAFVDGVDPAETAEGLDLAAAPAAAADSGQWIPSLYTGEVTISAWTNWAGPNSRWQGVVSNRVGAPPAAHNFFIEIRNDNGRLQVGGIPGAGDVQVSPLPVDEWAHLAITIRAGEIVIYRNGMPLATNTAGQAVPQNLVPLFIGALNRDAAEIALLNPFHGVLDDVRIYNYAMTGTQVADLYYDALEIAVCLNPNDVSLQFDVAGAGPEGNEPDCRVSLADFAAFAQTWLNCGLYPQSDCQ